MPFKCRLLILLLFHSSSSVARTRCNYPRRTLPVRRMSFSSLTSHSRHNKGVPATDGGWPAGRDLPGISTNVSTHKRFLPDGPFKGSRGGGRGEKKKTAVYLTATLSCTTRCIAGLVREHFRSSTFILSEQSGVFHRPLFPEISAADTISCTWHLRKRKIKNIYIYIYSTYTICFLLDIICNCI